MDRSAPQPARQRESLLLAMSRLHALFASIKGAAEIGAALPPEPMRRLLVGIALVAREGIEETQRSSEVEGGVRTGAGGCRSRTAVYSFAQTSAYAAVQAG